MRIIELAPAASGGDLMDWSLIILIAFCAIWLGAIPFFVIEENREYNNGKCPKCGHEWRPFDTDHTGAVGLVCDNCKNVMWLDWCRNKLMR